MSFPGTLAGERATASSARAVAPPTLPSRPTPQNIRVPTVLGRGAVGFGRTREVAALVLWTLALFLGLALASFRGDPSGMGAATATPAGPDWVGPVGSA